MRKYIMAITILSLAVLLGPSTALAGGSSDSTGEGFHCYGFFNLPDDKFAQVMVNDEDPREVEKKFLEYWDKYVMSEGGELALYAGNVPGFCSDETGETTGACRGVEGGSEWCAEEVTEEACETEGGEWDGGGQCSDETGETTGACRGVEGGSEWCAEEVTEEACETEGGEWDGGAQC